jgi:hypothetical protein
LSHYCVKPVLTKDSSLFFSRYQCFFCRYHFENHIQWFELVLISTTSLSVNNSVLLITTTSGFSGNWFWLSRFLRYIQNFELWILDFQIDKEPPATVRFSQTSYGYRCFRPHPEFHEFCRVNKSKLIPPDH